MSDEIEDASMNNSPARLSEASFAKDWDSAEDKIYDLAELEARLLALIEATSPGPWAQAFERDYESGEETKYPIVLAAPGTAYGGHRLQIIGGFRDEDDMALADARLAALAPGLAVAVELVRALREYKDYFDPGWTDDRPRWALMKRESKDALARWETEVLETL